MTDQTVITIEYDCPHRHRYDIPTSLPGDASVLRQPALVDTLAALADAQHDAECPPATDRSATISE